MLDLGAAKKQTAVTVEVSEHLFYSQIAHTPWGVKTGYERGGSFGGLREEREVSMIVG